jgi:hypothetical protein
MTKYEVHDVDQSAEIIALKAERDRLRDEIAALKPRELDAIRRMAVAARLDHEASEAEIKRLRAALDVLREILKEALQMLEIYYQPNIGADGQPLQNEEDRAPTIYRIRRALEEK